jgi:environmental stress-induced protein Ves
LRIIRKHEQKTTLWSGGKTTELFIYPEGSSYVERNFQFRISTASIETEASEFSHLPGFKRHLMILDGTLKIHHENHYQKTLNKFESDQFMGDWKTSAEGKVIDFNLMCDNNFDGIIKAVQIEKNNHYSFNTDSDFTAFYANNKSVFHNSILLNEGDFLITNEKNSYSIFSQEKANLIIININSLKL